MKVISQVILFRFSLVVRLLMAGFLMALLIVLNAPDASAQKRGDDPYKGDITGRKHTTKKSPRPRWRSGSARADPYAGKKRRSKASRAKAYRQTARYNAQHRAMSSKRSERSYKIKRVTPRSASGAYRVRNRKNPYIFRKKSPWEKAYQGDITGRRFKERKTPDRPRAKQPRARYNKIRQGDKPYNGKIGIGFNSISRGREHAGKAVGNKTAGSVRTSFTGKSRYLRTSSSGMSISRDPERQKKFKRVSPRSASGAYRVRKRKNPYVFRERSQWEKAFQGDITGRSFRTKRTTERPGIGKPPKTRYSSKNRRGDKSYSGSIQANYRSATRKSERAWKNDISGNRLRTRSSKQPDFSGAQFKAYPKGRRRGDDAYNGKIKGGKFQSVTSAEERSGRKLKPNRPPGEGIRRVWNFQGNIKTSKVLKGGGSISGKKWNNKGRPIPGAGPQTQDNRIARFQGNVKGKKVLTGGGSVARNDWNNKGTPIPGRGPRRQDHGIARFQGDVKGKRVLTGGGSVGRNDWNNEGKAIPGRGIKAQDRNVAAFQGQVKHRRSKLSKDSKRAAEYRGEIPHYMLEKGPDKDFSFTGNIKGRRKYVKNPSADKKSLKVKTLKRNDHVGEYAGSTRATKRKGGRDDDFSFTGNIKQRRNYVKNPNAARQSLNVKAPKDAQRGGRGDYQKYKGNLKQFDYRRNPNADERALKVRGPERSARVAANFQGFTKRENTLKKNKMSAKESLKTKYPAKDAFKGGAFQGNVKANIRYKRNPNSAEGALKVNPPARASAEGMRFKGRVKVTSSYKRNRNASDEALKGIGVSRAAVQASNFQGNLKMQRKRIEDRHPDFKYLSSRSNGKVEKEKFFSFKLFWSKLFRKEENQPDNLKEKERKPRYDRSEEGLWND